MKADEKVNKINPLSSVLVRVLFLIMETHFMNDCNESSLMQRLEEAEKIWFFLDYDGTLADFAQTPDEIIPDPALLDLIRRLTAAPDIRVAIISGRRLGHIQQLLPLPGILKAGSYGLELETADGQVIHRLELDQIRPFLDRLKRSWSELVNGRLGFYLEDKGWTLAIHAKDARKSAAEYVLDRAQHEAIERLKEDEQGVFRLQGGHRFLECGPKMGDKKGTVEYILQNYPWHDDALLVYLGDDDKDEVAFEAIQDAGGIVVAVGDRLPDDSADCQLESPTAVRRWLERVIALS